MDHNFNIDIAKKYGVNEAIFIHNLYFWIKKNKANGKHLYDGKTWTYNSTAAFEELFPYWSRQQIDRIITKLRKEGLVFLGNHNKVKFDRTRWFALSESIIAFYECDKSIYRNQEIHLSESINGNIEIDEPIPDSKPDSKPDKYNTDKESRAKPKRASRFSPPSLEEIKAYCKERRNQVDAQRFIDFYTSKDWMIGKNKMKDWQASVRTWEQRDKAAGKQKMRLSDIAERSYTEEELSAKVADPLAGYMARKKTEAEGQEEYFAEKEQSYAEH